MEQAEIYLNRLWRRDDLKQVVIYKMDDFSTVWRLLHAVKWSLFRSPPIQMLVVQRANINKRLGVVIESAIAYCKKSGLITLADLLKRLQNYNDTQFRRICYLLNEYQDRYTQVKAQAKVLSVQQEAKVLEAKDKLKRQEFENKYMKKEATPWEDGRDPRTGKHFWKNRQTGQVVYTNPLLGGAAPTEDMTVAQRQLLEAKKRRDLMKRGAR